MLIFALKKTFQVRIRVLKEKELNRALKLRVEIIKGLHCVYICIYRIVESPRWKCDRERRFSSVGDVRFSILICIPFNLLSSAEWAGLAWHGVSDSFNFFHPRLQCQARLLFCPLLRNIFSIYLPTSSFDIFYINKARDSSSLVVLRGVFYGMG